MKLRNLRRQQSGFTLIELLVVIGILAILLAITLIAINPNKHFQDTRNAKRSSDVSAILDAVYEYQSGNAGSLPSNINGLTANTATEVCIPAGTPTVACPASGTINMCNLTPTYLADLPTDPNSSKGFANGGSTPCGSGTTDYDTGYTITKTSSGRFTVSAPNAEGGATISVTR